MSTLMALCIFMRTGLERCGSCRHILESEDRMSRFSTPEKIGGVETHQEEQGPIERAKVG
jgi:hypothetical protein